MERIKRADKMFEQNGMDNLQMYAIFDEQGKFDVYTNIPDDKDKLTFAYSVVELLHEERGDILSKEAGLA